MGELFHRIRGFHRVLFSEKGTDWPVLVKCDSMISVTKSNSLEFRGACQFVCEQEFQK